MNFSVYNYILFFGLSFVTIGCSSTKPIKNETTVQTPSNQGSTTSISTHQHQSESRKNSFFDELFKKYPQTFGFIEANNKVLNVQIIYTQIDRNEQGKPSFKHYYYNELGQKYFYPASAVKLPVALLALEKSANIAQKTNKNITNAAMITEVNYSGQTAVYNDPDAKSGTPSIAQYIKKILLVSDNDAFNRLYEFVGQEAINTELHKKGYNSASILHRLSIILSDIQNQNTNPVNFYDENQQMIYSEPGKFNKEKYPKRKDFLGNAYYSNGKLIQAPMDFSNKNRFSLQDLHTVMQALIFPTSVNEKQRFNITNEDRNLVLKHMSAYPRESKFPYYDGSLYGDGYAKSILFGEEKSTIPSSIRVFNKSGTAYGQLTDVAYIIDTEKKIEFMLSATIYCNNDGILNDDKYDYQSIGYPFLKNLGNAIYNYELNRSKKHLPDLSSFIFNYDN